MTIFFFIKIKKTRDIIWSFQIRSPSFLCFLESLLPSHPSLLLIHSSSFPNSFLLPETRAKRVTFDEPSLKTNLAMLMKKVSQSGIMKMKRVLHLTAECIVYYGKVPSDWKSKIIYKDKEEKI